MADLVLRNARLIATMDGTRRELAGGWVAVTGGLIQAVGTSAEAPPAAAEVVDVGDCLVTPGLINSLNQDELLDLLRETVRSHLTADVEEEKTVNLGTPATSQILTGSGQFKNFEQTFSKVGWTVGENWQFSDHSGLFARYTPTFRLPSISSYVTATLPTTT